MYRKPRFLEELHAIREEMSRECDYDVDLFAELIRSGNRPPYGPVRNIRGARSRAPSASTDGIPSEQQSPRFKVPKDE
ncbi:MAG TPA: hypothetical protein VFV34_23265 [Blastocatellia bacterium]|nr:hypothetical protein [Blastocatellia bacterium]